MQFSKWHALGNSYLVVERDEARPIDDGRVRRLCDGDIGIGSDGLIEFVRHEGPVGEVVIWNPDGSTAEMSGNGIRIAARWLAALSEADEVEIQTAGRSVTVRMLGDREARAELGDVTVGEPELIDVNGPVELTTASLGNPHAVIRLDSVSREDLLRLGPQIETHFRFPERTNVQLVRVDGGKELTVLVWERGAGETSASGSSAVAAAAVAVSRGWCRSPITVHLPGGDLVVELDGARAALVGPAERDLHGYDRALSETSFSLQTAYDPHMGRIAAVLAVAALVAVGAVSAADDLRPLAASGLVVRAPSDWGRIAATEDDRLTDPATLLVVGTRGVAARPSDCQVAAYRVPVAGAVVVILGWRGVAADGIPRDRTELASLRLRKPIFACWTGRGAVGQIALKGHGYQVNVLVGDHATPQTVADAMAVARSLALGTS